MCTGSPCKCLSWRQLWHRLCLCQGAPAPRDPTINKPVCAAEPMLPATGCSRQGPCSPGVCCGRRAGTQQQDGSGVAESPGAVQGPVGPHAQLRAWHSSSQHGAHQASPCACRWEAPPGPPFPRSLPPRGQQDLALDSRRAPGPGQAGPLSGEPPWPSLLSWPQGHARDPQVGQDDGTSLVSSE